MLKKASLKVRTSLVLAVLLSLNFHALQAANCSSTLSQHMYALVVNTSNDFPLNNEMNVDAMPGQALQAYYTLRSIGLDDDKITLMLYYKGDSFIDFEGSGKNALEGAVIDVENGDITVNAVHEELLKLGRKTKETGGQLLVYIIGHGEYVNETSSFLLFENGEKLSGVEFASWMNETNCEDAVVLLDSCYSWAFATPLIQNGNFTVVSSTDCCHVGWYYWGWANYLSDEDKAIFGNCGSVFFHPFWVKIKQGYSIEEAFNYGREMCIRWAKIDPEGGSFTKKQNPQLYLSPKMRSNNNFWKFALAVAVLIAGAIIVVGVVWIIYKRKQPDSRNMVNVAIEICHRTVSFSSQNCLVRKY